MGKTDAETRLFRLLAALAAAAAAWALLWQRPYSVQNFEFYADRGELLFHAFRSKAVSYSMPLLSLMVSSVRYHLGLDPGLLAKAAGLLLALPAYAIGARGGGRVRGALFALAALAVNAGSGVIEAEQVVYSLALLVFLGLELARQASPGPALSAASGLAAGVTLLVRSPLFAFPPLAALYHFFSRKPRFGRWLAATALFLAASYAMLLPWARLNLSLFGEPILLEQERSTCNVITGASGVIYTIEGDARAFAGLSRTESPYPWAARKVLSAPLNYAGAVAKRLWQVFLMSPLLFLLGAAGLAAWRSREAGLLAFFCAYFVLLHCLLSVEERYFYPLRFPLAFLAAGGLWKLAKGRFGASGEPRPDRLTPALLGLLLAGSAWTLAIVWRYPAAARHPLFAAEEELSRRPADPWLHRKKGETLLSLDLTAAGRESLGRACALGGGADLCCVTAALASGEPQACPALEGGYETLLVKTLRELELGRRDDAGRSFAEAFAHWSEERNGIKAIPYSSDLEHLRRIRETNKTFWDMDLYSALLYWPPEARPELLRRLARLTPLTPKLRAVQLAGGSALSPAEKKELEALRAALGPELQPSEFDWEGTLDALRLKLLPEAGGIPADAPGLAGRLLALRLSPAEARAAFAPRGRENGAALRAAAETFLAPPGGARAAAARRLADADPSDFTGSLVSLKEEGFSAVALAAAERRLRAHPYPLAAGAALYAARGEKRAALGLAGAAADYGRLPEDGWNLALMAAQAAGDYGAGLRLAGRALREHPRSATLLNSRGVLRKLAGDRAGALADFGAAAAADPRAFSAQLNLALELEGTGRTAEAAEAYRRAAAAAPPGPARDDAERGLSRVNGGS